MLNRSLLMGRPTGDPEVRYSMGDSPLAVARFTLAVGRNSAREGAQTTDFISCVSFGRVAERMEKYLRKGVKIVVEGRIQTGSYTNKDGVKVYTTEVVVEDFYFAESKKESGSEQAQGDNTQMGAGFLNIPEGIDDEIPFPN